MDDQVRTVFSHAIIKGEELALVELTDGTITIFHSGAMVEGCCWPAGELPRGMDCFADLHSRVKAGAAWPGERPGK